jgi:type IV pilus assembly protein PilM
MANGYSSEFTDLVSKFDTLTKTGENLQSNVDGRLLWLELLKAIDAALPKDERPIDQRKETAEDVTQRPELHITAMDCEHFADISQWYSGVERYYEARKKQQSAPAADGPANGAAAEAVDTAQGGPSPAEGGATPIDETAPAAEQQAADPVADAAVDATATDASGSESGDETWQSQPGWVIQLDGYHFFNSDKNTEGAQFIFDTFFKNLEESTVSLPDGPNRNLIDVPIADLGIHHPVVITDLRIQELPYFPEATDEDASQLQSRRAMAMENARPEPGVAAVPGDEVKQPPKEWKLRRYDFRIQFCWQPVPRGKRLEKQAEKQNLSDTAATDSDSSVADESESG